MKRKNLILATLPALCIGAAAHAHPHIFVQTEVEIVVDDAGAVSGVRLTWIYDDFFSLLMSEELGIDPDGDLELTDAELKSLTDYVLDWPDDFGGDLFLTQNGEPVALGARQDASVAFIAGLVSESHFRPLAAPVDGASPVQVQVYDPFYYVAYEMVGDVRLTGGAGCDAVLQKADLNAAYSLVDEMLYGRPASDVGPDEAFPEVGVAFADTVTVTCSQ